MLTDVSSREAFHVLLLEHVLRRLGEQPPSAFVLKGGVNLRLYFGSPRYSQDIDFDADLRLRDALRAAIRSGLQDPALQRQFITLGGEGVRVPDGPNKDTDTTLRYKFGVIRSGGIDLATKIEVSFRPRPELDIGTIDPAAPVRIAPYRTPERASPAPHRRRRSSGAHSTDGTTPPELPPLLVPHYGRLPALRQKIGALAGRTEVQARDIFDLTVLGAATLVPEDAVALRGALAESTLREAQARTLEVPYEDYRDKVLDFLDAPDRDRFEAEHAWDGQCLVVHELVTRLLALPVPGAEPDAPPPDEEDEPNA